MPQPSRLRRLVYALVLILATVLLGEVLLRAARRASPRVEYALRPAELKMIYPDPVLGYRTSPYYPGHDKRGFRNDHFPQRVDIVAIGDSLTYGYAASSENSWPRWLERLSGRSVYNAGSPSYAANHYEIIAEEMLELRPSTVILGLYLGNDIMGAYGAVYGNGLDPVLFPEFASTDPAVVAEIANAESTASLHEIAVARGMEDRLPDRPHGISSWVKQRSSLYALARALTVELFRGPPQPVGSRRDETYEESDALGDYIGLPEPRRFRTVFWHPMATALWMEIEEPRIGEGFRITRDALLRMHRRLADRDVRFVVVVLHTKSYVYARALPDFLDAMPPGTAHLATTERKLTDEIMRFLAINGITAVDTADELVRCFERGVRPFPESRDGHPNGDGYEAIARAILPAVDEDG